MDVFAKVAECEGKYLFWRYSLALSRCIACVRYVCGKLIFGDLMSNVVVMKDWKIEREAKQVKQNLKAQGIVITKEIEKKVKDLLRALED